MIFTFLLFHTILHHQAIYLQKLRLSLLSYVINKFFCLCIKLIVIQFSSALQYMFFAVDRLTMFNFIFLPSTFINSQRYSPTQQAFINYPVSILYRYQSSPDLFISYILEGVRINSLSITYPPLLVYRGRTLITFCLKLVDTSYS